jgi:cytochrome P450
MHSSTLRRATRASSASCSATASWYPPEHTRYRALVQQAFTRRSLEAWREALVVPYAHRLVDALAARRR